MNVYLAGPISLGGTCSSQEVGAFLLVFAAEADRLRNAGCVVLDPAELPKLPTWEDYMRATLPMVCRADVVAVLPRWRESRGAMLEAFVASQLGIPIADVGDLPVSEGRTGRSS